MFVCTANSLNIPTPLLDRMEIIRIPGYIEDEKINIADKYLLPKQMKRNGVKEKEIKFNKNVILSLIRYYTREAGVRGLERQIAKILRKVVKERLINNESKTNTTIINNKNLPIISLDIPSGINPDDGRIMGQAINAEMTITFMFKKLCFFLGEGANYSGVIKYSDLEVPCCNEFLDNCDLNIIDRDYVFNFLQRRSLSSHKGDFGHIGIFGSGKGMHGASLPVSYTHLTQPTKRIV